MTIRPIGLAALLAAGFTFAFVSSSAADDGRDRAQAGLLMQVDDDDDDDDRPRRTTRSHYRSYHDDDRRWHRRYHGQRYAKVCRTVWMHDDWGRSWRQTFCR